jgi:hypothetical protein
VIERLLESIRYRYATAAEVARRIGVRAETLYSRLAGESNPASLERIEAFLGSMPGGTLRHHADGLRVSGIQELARHFRSRGVALFVSRQRVRFGRSVAASKVFVRIAVRRGRGGRIMIRPSGGVEWKN